MPETLFSRTTYINIVNSHASKLFVYLYLSVQGDGASAWGLFILFGKAYADPERGSNIDKH